MRTEFFVVEQQLTRGWVVLNIYRKQRSAYERKAELTNRAAPYGIFRVVRYVPESPRKP